MHSSAINKSPQSVSVGLETVSLKFGVELQLPSYEALLSSSINEPHCLEKIFELDNLESLFFKSISPIAPDSSLFCPSVMQPFLFQVKLSLKKTALEDISSARHIGKIFKILDEENQLLDLLRMYRQAIFQG